MHPKLYPIHFIQLSSSFVLNGYLYQISILTMCMVAILSDTLLYINAA